MKFSVLLPTRNRLEYLRYAIASVLKQNYDNWEVIVSDNYSENDIKGYVESLKDPRIKYFRTFSFLPVTDSWNFALEKSTGDYVIMLGDDDCLLKGYFKTCIKLIHEHNFPDMLYNSALNYAYPKVMPRSPNGYLDTWNNACFLKDTKTPYILDKNETLRLVQKTLNFTIEFNFNAQFSLINRTLIKKLQSYGSFYQSPYPDYYSTTAMLLKADRILAVPFPMVVIGISPKSFGYYYFNNKEKQGMEFLKNIPEDLSYQTVKEFLLPGTDMNSSWLLAMEMVRINFQKEFQLKVNYKKYRFLQVLHSFRKFACKEGLSLIDMVKFSKNLFLWEKLLSFIPFLIAFTIRLNPQITLGKSLAYKLAYAFSHPSHGTAKHIKGNFENIMDVFQQVDIDASVLTKPE